MNVVLIDDEPLALDLMEKLLQSFPKITILGSHTNPFKGKKEVLTQPVELVFLDINLPEVNGLELAEQLLEEKPELHIIFVTAYDEYAVKAFELNALDYIVKPVRKKRLENSLARLQERIKMEPKAERISKNKELRIRLSGQLGIQSSNSSPIFLNWRTKKSKEMFLYLLSREGQVISKTFLMDLLWPDYPEEKATALMYTTAYHVRKTLKELGTHFELKNKGESYLLLTHQVVKDIEEWEEAIDKFSWNIEKNVSTFSKAMEKFDQPYLEQADYLWLEPERQRLEMKWIRAAEKLAHEYASKGQFNEAEAIYHRIIQRAPYHEEAYFLLMKLYTATHREEKAKHTYHSLKIYTEVEYSTHIHPKIKNWYQQTFN